MRRERGSAFDRILSREPHIPPKEGTKKYRVISREMCRVEWSYDHYSGAKEADCSYGFDWECDYCPILEVQYSKKFALMNYGRLIIRRVRKSEYGNSCYRCGGKAGLVSNLHPDDKIYSCFEHEFTLRELIIDKHIKRKHNKDIDGILGVIR